MCLLIDLKTRGSGRIHMLSHPLDPDDIMRIARELGSLMLPEVKSAVIEAVKEATAPLQTQIDVLKSDTRQLEDENVDLKSRVDELEKKVSTNEDNIDILEQYSRSNTLRISGIPEEPNESTIIIIIIKSIFSEDNILSTGTYLTYGPLNIKIT